jgi:alkylation response protein AidB-like acyl-CoA dehydrogenase
MSVYTAPLRDMLFTMKEVGGLEAICAQPGHEETTPDLVEAILQEAAHYAAGVLDSLNRTGDVQGARWHDGEVTPADGFREAWSSFCENGWIGMPASTEWGGQGLPTLVSTAVLEMWKSSNLAFSLCQMLTLGAVEAIAHHGSEALKQRFLEPMVAGRWTGTMNLTEPQAGSDLAALRSRAVPEGDHYRISGNKIFITWGEHDMTENIVHLVLARLPDAPPGVKGISLFLCPKFLVNDDGSLGERNDLACTSIEHKLGIHGSPTASMTFGDNGGAIGYLVGEPHQGLACMFTMMNHARLNVGLEGVGVSERAYQHARAYALERVQGKPALAGRQHHRWPPRRAAHADGHEGAHRGHARAGLFLCRPDGPRRRTPRCAGARAGTGPGWPADACGQRLVHRQRTGHHLRWPADSWRHGLYRGNRGRAVLPRCPHHDDL